MGGSGNMGEQPTGQLSALGSAPRTAVPGWSGSAPTPAAPAATTTAAPPTSRPYELQTPSTGVITNLGLPSSSTPSTTGFNHTPYPTTHAAPPTAAPTPAPAAPTAPTTPEAPKESPDDWLYPGNLPTDFHARPGKEFGKPWDYAATGPSYTPGYGAAGNFGGVAGYGPQQVGLKDQVLLPEMKAGTQLKDAQIDQYNRVRRADYDRYMKLYGVGYDLPAYQNALNGLVYQFNTQYNTPGSGG